MLDEQRHNVWNAYGNGNDNILSIEDDEDEDD